MKYLYKVAVLLTVLIPLNGCIIHSKRYWNEKELQYENHQKKIIFSDLSKSMNVKVLYFEGLSHFDLLTYPNLVFAVNKENDTILFIDKVFEGVIENGDTINMLPDEWSINEKEYCSPTFPSIKNREFSKLLMSVEKGYYSKIDTSNVKIKKVHKRYTKCKRRRFMGIWY